MSKSEYEKGGFSIDVRWRIDAADDLYRDGAYRVTIKGGYIGISPCCIGCALAIAAGQFKYDYHSRSS